MNKKTVWAIVAVVLLFVVMYPLGKPLVFVLVDYAFKRLPPPVEELISSAHSGQRWNLDTTNLTSYAPVLAKHLERFNDSTRVQNFYNYVVRGDLFLVPPRLFIVRDEYCSAVYYMEDFTHVEEGIHTYKAYYYVKPDEPWIRVATTVTLEKSGDTLSFSNKRLEGSLLGEPKKFVKK